MSEQGVRGEAVDLLYSLIDSIETSTQPYVINARNAFNVIYMRYKNRKFNNCELQFRDKNLNPKLFSIESVKCKLHNFLGDSG